MKKVLVKIVDAIDNLFLELYPGLTKHMKK